MYDKRYRAFYGIEGRKLPTFEVQIYNLLIPETAKRIHKKWRAIIHRYC